MKKDIDLGDLDSPDFNPFKINYPDDDWVLNGEDLDDPNNDNDPDYKNIGSVTIDLNQYRKPDKNARVFSEEAINKLKKELIEKSKNSGLEIKFINE